MLLGKPTQKNHPELNTILVSCSTHGEMFCCGEFFLNFRTYGFAKKIFFGIYLMWTVSGSAPSNNLKPTKTQYPVKFGFSENLGLTP